MASNAQRKKVTRQTKEERLSAIMLAAREIFEQKGYEQAKMADIAERVGVAEGTVFHYFSSKRLLVLKLMEQFYEEIIESLQQGIAGITGTRNRLHFVISHHLQVIDKNAEFCGVIIRESRGVDADLTRQIRQSNRAYTRCLSQTIKDGIAKGELNPDTSITLVRNTVYGSIEHALWQRLAEGQPMKVTELAEQLCALVYDGIRVRQEVDRETEILSLVQRLNDLLEA